MTCSNNRFRCSAYHGNPGAKGALNLLVQMVYQSIDALPGFFNIMRKYVLVIVMWLVLVVVFGAAGYILVRPATSETLRNNPIVTQGRVVAKEPQNHGIIRYSYTVDGQTYTGIGHGGGGNPKFEDLAIGNLVRVVYNSKKPSESFMGFPEHDLRVNRAGAIFFALVPSTFISLTVLGLLILVSRARADRT